MRGALHILLGIGSILLVVVAMEILYVRFNGKNVPAPQISRSPMQFGAGEQITYVVMGDSTSISQGGTYENGFAVQSAQHLGKSYAVTMYNTGISGATAASVRSQQLDEAMKYRPDVVLLAVGANDITKRTPFDAVQRDLQAIVTGLRTANPTVQIILTRSPAVDAVDRFGPVLSYVIKSRVTKLNAYLDPFIAQNNLIVAPVAEQTRQTFIDNPKLLAADNFHPNDEGYAVWVPVINIAIDQAVSQLRSKTE